MAEDSCDSQIWKWQTPCKINIYVEAKRNTLREFRKGIGKDVRENGTLDL